MAVFEPGTIAHDTVSTATSARSMSTLALRAVDAALDGQAHGRSGFAADPDATSSRSWSSGGLTVDRHDDVAGAQVGGFGRAVAEHADDQRTAILGGVDPDADPDIRTGQLLGSLLALLRGQERGVPGVADGVGQALDRPVGEGRVVELVGADIVLVEDVPGVADQGERAPDAASVGLGVDPSPPPTAGDAKRPTPIPTPNVSTSAKPVANRRIASPRPRPAAGDRQAWEGPSANEFASGGLGSVVGSVGIGSWSIAGIVLASR